MHGAEITGIAASFIGAVAFVFMLNAQVDNGALKSIPSAASTQAFSDCLSTAKTAEEITACSPK